MAKNLTQSNVNFTVNTSEAAGGFSTKRTNSALLANGKYSVSTKQALIDSGYESQGGFSINAVDIDWNKADLANSTAKWPASGEYIETTGQLLAAIKAAYNHVEIGTTSSTAAAGNHTHNLTLATDSGTPTVTLSAATTYKLTSGGKSLIFKTPADANTTYSLANLIGTTAIGNATKPIYWNGSKFVTANNYPSGVSALTLTKTGTSTIDLLANTTYTLTVGDKTLAFKTPADNTGSAADGNTWRPVYIGSNSILTNSISSGNLKFDGGEQINPKWDSTNKVIKFDHYRTDGRSYGTNQVPGLYKFASDAWGHIIAGAAVTKADITGLGIPAQDTVYTHPSYTAKSSGLYKITVDNKGHVSAATAVAKADITGLGIPAQDTVYTHPTYTAKSSGLYKVTVNSTGHVSATAAVTKSDITALGIPAKDTVYTHPTFTAKSSGLYKITVDANGHVTGTASITASDLKAAIKDLLVAGDNVTITENSAGKLVISCSGSETIALKVLGTLKENGAEVVMTATTATVQSVLATDTNTYVNSSWAIDNTTNFSINATSNVSAVTVTANVSAAKGTVSGSIGLSSQTTSYGKRALTASFTQVPTTKSTKVTATHDGSSSYVTLKYTKAGQAAGAYTWSGTLPSGLTFNTTTGTSIEVRNSTSSEITVAKDVVQVINANGKDPYKFGSFTVPGKQASTSYYYYAGWTQPTASNVDTIIAETYPSASGSTTMNTAGKKTTSKSSFSLSGINLYNSSAKTNYYVLVPTGQAIYDTVFGGQFGDDAFTSQGTITVGSQTHTIYKSIGTTRNIVNIEIK